MRQVLLVCLGVVLGVGCGTQDRPPAASAAASGGAVPDEQFLVRAVVTDTDGTTHTRMERFYKSLPVLGGDVVTHAPAGQTVRSTTAMLRSTADLDLDVRPGLQASRAQVVAANEFKGTLEDMDEPVLSVYARAGEPRLAWDVRAVGTREDQTPSELHVIVDARTGAVLERWDDVHTATGYSLYGGAVSLATDAQSGYRTLRDTTRGNALTTDMRNGTSSQYYFLDTDDVWGNGSESSTQSAAVDAHWGAQVTWDYYKNAHGRLGIKGDGVGKRSRVHYGRNYDNAFWSDSCQCMTYGDGNSFNPLVSLDVAGHEMTHGVTSATAGLTYSGESGGLNESTSDIFGTMVEFSAANASEPGNFTIGEKLSSQPLRYMDRPSRDGASADCYSSGVGSLDVHYSSGVGNHWFFLVSNGSGQSAYGNSPTCNGSTVTGIGRTAAARIYYRALTVYFTSSTNYAAARRGTLSAAADLYGAGSSQYAGVAAAWSAVGVN